MIRFGCAVVVIPGHGDRCVAVAVNGVGAGSSPALFYRRPTVAGEIIHSSGGRDGRIGRE